MATTTVKSEEARLKWRDTVDRAYLGGEIIVERHGKPVVAIINFDRWQQMRQLWLDMLAQRSAEVKAGNYVTFEEVEKALQAGRRMRWTIRMHRLAMQSLYQIERGEAATVSAAIRSLERIPRPPGSDPVPEQANVFTMSAAGHTIAYELWESERVVIILQIG